MTNALPHVVILGGGFGGLYAAKQLGRAPVRITLVDRKNHHVFQPLLYQVATAALNPSDIAAPIRSILRRQRNTLVILGEAVGVDLAEKKVVLADGDLSYDFLIIATGATHSYFSHPEWRKDAPGLKTIEDALEMRRRVLFAYEAAERTTDPERQRAWLTFVVVGGGPTGVELAGALAEVARHALARDFRRIDPTSARVILLEGVSRVLPTYPERLSDKARSQLEELGVEVRTGSLVTRLDRDGVEIGTERIAARTILWAAGVQASPLARSLGVSLDRAGRVPVQADLTIPGHSNVFVVGDLAAAPYRGSIVPGVAQGAIQGGVHAAQMILRALKGRPNQEFHYKDRGSMATIGRGAAVADLGRVRLSGLPAWLAWLGIHILFLIGFRNRILVMIQWAWSYVTYQRAARLITGDLPPP
jgi:NADH dehydrogenase